VKPHNCRAVAFQKLATTTFLLKVQHTCPPNLDVDRDASLIAKAKETSGGAGESNKQTFKV
jgi:hypothetical protein